MKKWIALLMALVMLLSLCACTKDVDPGPQTDVDEPAVTEVVPEEPAPAVEEASPYPGKLPLGGETASGQVIEVPDAAKLEYLGSKVVFDDYDNPVLLSYFNYTNISEYEDSASWCMSVYAYQNGETLWPGSFTYNDVEVDDTLYEEIEAGESLEVCWIHDLEDLANPVTLSFLDTFEELEPVELVVDLAEVELCMEAIEGVSGLYMATYLYAQGNEWTQDLLIEYGLAENSYVELFDDNSGILCVAGTAAELVYDAECFYIGEQSLYYTIEDGVLTAEGDDLYYQFEYTDLEDLVVEEEPSASFAGETVTTDMGYVSITLDEGWYVGEPRSNYALTLYNEDVGESRWIEILDLQLTDLEHELEYTHYAMASAEYEEVTFGENTYQMLYSDTYGPQAYLVAETSTGKAFTVEVRSFELEEVMTMLESIVIG